MVPPGRCLVLLTADRSAVRVTSWPLVAYVRHAWPGAWVCSLFRNERPDLHLSSDLSTCAVAHTRAQWPVVPARGDRDVRRPGQNPPQAGAACGGSRDTLTRVNGSLTGNRATPP